ncbi:MAG: hypothetical protein ABSF70_17590 [Terracidiphilus sp.]
MKPQSIGRALGIGLRVAGRIAGQRMAAGEQTATSAPAGRVVGAEAGGAQGRGQAASRSGGRVAGSVARGVGGFLRPFRRLGGIVWLEVTGVFFLLPVAVFAPRLWSARASWAHGPDHRMFLITGAVMAVFIYLSVSSFWRAWRR